MDKEERLKFAMKKLGLTPIIVAKDLGYSRRQSVYDNLKPGKSTTKFVVAFCNKYGISGVWVETGKGTMQHLSKSEYLESKTFNDTATEIIPSNEETIISKAGMQFVPNRDGSYTMLTPHITEYGYGGYLRGFSDDKYLGEMPVFPIVVSEVHRGIYRSITMRGESMDDGSRESIRDGDVLTGRHIQRHLWEKDALHFKKHQFFIIHHTEGIIVKQIIDHDVPGQKIMIHSLNPDKGMYPDEWIDLNQVIEIFNVTHRSQKM